MPTKEKRLAQAQMNIERARNTIERQRNLIKFIEDAGRDSKEAKELLSQFEQSLHMLEKHLAEIQAMT